MRASEATIAFTKAAPERIRRATAIPRSGSAVHTLAPRPKRVSLATRTAASSPSTTTTAATGPKISSSYAGWPGTTSVSTVGA
jgi:hypothetical protein